MPRTRLDNNTTLKIQSRIVSPARFKGMKNFPTANEGNIIPGTYVVEFYIHYQGKRYSKNKIYEFDGPPTVNKKIKIEGEFPTISHYSDQSDTPTMWNDADISLVGKTATYEKYVDGVLVETIDVTAHLTLDKSGVAAGILPSNYMLKGLYSVLFEVDYTDADGDVVFASATQGVLVKDLITPSCVDARNGQVVRKGDDDYDLICGIRGKWQLNWEPASLTPIDVIISDPNNPASFPTVEQMKEQGVKPILTDLLENVQYELQYTEQGPTPAFPAEMYTRRTSRTYEYTAINLTVDGQVLLKPAELRILNQRLIRRINFNSPELRPNVYREILWEPATLTDDIVVQDHQSSSFPSSASLMQNVRAYWVDEQGQENDLTVTMTRPHKSIYAYPSPYSFDANGEVNTYIPSTWSIKYEATIPASAGTFTRYPAITSKKTKRYIVEDTIPPEIVTNNGLAFPPSHLELGTNLGTFMTTWGTTPTGGALRPNLYALDKPRHVWSPWGSNLYPFVFFPVSFRVLHLTENRDMTAEEFNSLQHGEFFRIEAITTDDSGNSNTGQIYTIECVDTTVPTLTVTGLTIPMSTTPPDLSAGVSTFDLSEPVNVEYTVPNGTDWNTPSFVSIPYTATDAVGLQTTKNRTIVIYDPSVPPITSPPTTPIPPSVSIVPVVADKATKALPVDFNKTKDDLYYEWKLDGVVVVPTTKGSDGGYDYTTPLDSQNKVLEVTVHDEPTLAASTETATDSTTVGAGVIPACGAVVPDALRLNGTEDLRNFTDADWTENLVTRDGAGNPVNVDYVVHDISKQWLAMNAFNPDGTIIYTSAGLTSFNFNVDVYYGNYFIHCVTRYIEIYDTLAPVITLPPDPIVLNITQTTTVDDVTNQLKAALTITDNFSSLANIVFTIGDLTTSEATTEGTYTKTVRAEDEVGNATDMDITFQLVIVDSDGDGISDSRDQFPSDDLYTTDIDGDGVGDDDSVVIWHHDFHDTLNYLSVRETEINETLTLNTTAQQIQYAEVVTGPETGQKKSVAMENGFHLSTNNVDASPVSIQNTSLSFTLGLQNDFSLDNTDTGMLIFFEGAGNWDSTKSRLEIKIKKLEQISTGTTVYRFSVYHMRQNLSTNANHVFTNSKYSNTTGNALAIINATDLADYNILNDIGNDELYLGNTNGYEIGHYVTNFDLPIDGKLHAYSFVFQNRTDQASGFQIAFYADGELRQLLFKYANNSFGFDQGPVSYNLYGFDSTHMSDYIWSTMTDANDIINIHEKLLITTYPASTLNDDTDGDGLTNLTEDISGVYDKTEVNTDVNANAPHYTDGIDDYIEKWKRYFATPLSTTTVVGNRGYTKQTSSTEDFSQVDQIGNPTNKEFVNYYNKGISFSSHLLQNKSTIAFWWLNDGNLPNAASILDASGSPGWPPLAWDGTGTFYTKNWGPVTTGTGTVPGFRTTYNTLAGSEGAQWKHFAAVFDIPNGEIKIYIDSVLFDTVTGYTGGGSARLNWNINNFKWTDFAMWSTTLEQKHINQIYARGKNLEYDLRGQYEQPAIATDTNPIITGFNYENVAADYTDELLKANLTFAAPLDDSSTVEDDQTVDSIVVNKYDLDAAISATESTSGTYDIIVEATTNHGIKTYVRRQVTISAPLQGFVEELPFMPSPIGTPVNFTNLSPMSEMPVAVGASHLHLVTDMDSYVGQAAQVLVPASNFNHITNKFTFSFWIKGYANSGAPSQKLFTTNAAGTGHALGMTKHYWQANKWNIFSGLSDGTYTFTNAFSDWTHIVITYSFENGLRIYTNGSHSHTRPANVEDRSLDMTDTIQIGGLGSHGMSFDSVQFEGWEIQESQVAIVYALGRTNKILRPPVITLPDENTFVAYLDDFPAQDDPGATAVDFNDDALSWSSDWSTVIGTSPDTGDYVVTYTATDSLGITTTKTRNVQITVPLRGFMEELPFMPNTLGATAENFTELNGDTALATNGGIVRIPGSNYSHITDTYTISFWFKRTGTGANGAFFKSNDALGGHEEGINLTFRGSNSDLQVYSGFQNWQYNQVFWTNWFFPNDSTWHHVAITFEIDASDVCKLKVYRDGSTVFLNTRTFNKRTNATALDWSGDVIVKSLANFQVDSFEMVDYVLTETGVNNLVAAGRHVFMSEIAQSNTPVVYNLTHEPILAGPSAAQITHNMRSNKDLYGYSPWMNSSHIPLYNFCNDKYTLSVWFKVTGGFGPLLVTHYDAQTTGIWLESLNDGLKYGTPNGTQTIYDWPVDKDTSFADGEWHHVAATWDHAAGTRALYLDGVKMTGGNDTFTPNSGNPNNETMLFYRRWGTPQNYGYQGAPAGKYGNVHLLNYILSEPQITDIYNAGHLGITLEASDVPDAPDAYVEDVEDGNGVITATSNWNTVIGTNPSAGTYTVTYSATDSHGDTTDLDVSVVVL